MAQIATGHPIVSRLSNLRKRVRMLLALHGAAVVVGAALATLVVLVTTDYLLHLGHVTRLVIGLAAVVGVLALLWRRLIAPLSTRLTEQFLASRVENISAGMADELIAAVNFIRAGTPQANALAAKAVEAAEARARGVKFEDALDFRPVAKVGGAAAGLVALVALVAIANPGFAATGFARWANPMGTADWPKVMKVELLWDKTGGTQPTVLPQGEAVEIRAHVTGPAAMTRRVYLYTSTDVSRETYRLMQCQAGESSEKDAVYAIQIAPEDAKYINMRAQAVDDETKSVLINLARRPAVSALTAKIAPPDYVAERSEALVDLLQQRAVAVEGSHLTFTIKCTNPIGRTDAAAPAVTFLDLQKETPVPVAYAASFAGEDRTTALVTMDASASLSARVQVKDENGFVNLSGGAFTVDVGKDAVPTVSIEEPRGLQRLLPTAVLPMKVQVTDDLGVDQGKMRVENFDTKPGDTPRSETALAWKSRIKDQGGNTVAATAFDWALAEMNVKPGDRLTVYAMALDNYNVGGKRHEWQKSPALSVAIVTEKELLDEKRAELMDLKNKVEMLTRQQEETKAKTDAVQGTIAKAGQATAAQASQLAELTAQQAQESATAKSLSDRFEQLRKSLETNRLGQTDLAKAAEGGKNTMADVSDANMNKAAGELGKAADAAQKGTSDKASESSKGASAKDASESAGAAGKEQKQAIEKMEELAKELKKQDDFNRIAGEVKALEKEQREVGNQVDKIAESTSGKPTGELTPQEKKDLSDLRNKQDDLQKRTAALIDQMKNMATASQDSAQKESLDKAAQAGEKADVTGNQGSASKSIGENKTGSASSSSSAAAAGLEKMGEELENVKTRELEKISQQLADLIKLLTAHKEAEEALKAKTVAAGEAAKKDALTPLANDQGRVHLATIDTQKKAEAVKEARPAAPLINEAADAMQASAVALVGVKQAEAVPQEDAAISALQKAIEKIKEAKAPIDNKLKEKDLAYFIKQYEEMRKEQQTIKAGGEAVKKDPDGKYGRLANRTIAELDDGQAKLRTRLLDLSNDEKLKPYDAIVFINGEVATYMGEAQKRLGKAQLGPELSWHQKKAVDRLGEIIEALKEEKKKGDDFDSDGGGGGGGGGTPPLIPAAQELKLLKLLQLGVNRETVDKNTALVAAKDDAEKNAIGEQVQQLGATQDKIKDVANKVVAKFRPRAD